MLVVGIDESGARIATSLAGARDLRHAPAHALGCRLLRLRGSLGAPQNICQTSSGDLFLAVLKVLRIQPDRLCRRMRPHSQ